MTAKLPPHPAAATLHAGNLNWTLHLNREFPQDQAVVWDAITKADQVAQWTPFRPDHDLVATGDVWLTPMDGGEEDLRGRVLEVQSPSSLRYLWVSDQLRFELSPTDNGTLLTLAQTFEDRNAAPGLAAGWHVCLGALELLLAGREVPSVVGVNAMKYGWEDLMREYKAIFNENADVTEPTGSR